MFASPFFFFSPLSLAFSQETMSGNVNSFRQRDYGSLRHCALALAVREETGRQFDPQAPKLLIRLYLVYDPCSSRL